MGMQNGFGASSGVAQFLSATKDCTRGYSRVALRWAAQVVMHINLAPELHGRFLA